MPEEHARAGSSTLNDSLAEFVFVERDGSKLYAVAYSFLDNRLHYVTKEGVRHTVTLDSLDLGTTQKLNEQLGNTINLPSLPPSGDALNISPAPLRKQALTPCVPVPASHNPKSPAIPLVPAARCCARSRIPSPFF